jgi:outer membrane lipoprotein-sorting protein
MLQLPNGYNAIKSDLSSLTGDVCHKVAQNAAVSRVTSSTLSGPKWDVPVKILEVKDANSGERSDLIYINAKTAVPVEWDVYRAGKLISICTFGNFKANSGLDDRLFEL